jgi:hypothetical protein
MTALSRIEGVGSRHTRTSTSRLALWLRCFSAAVVVIFGNASAQAQLDWRLVNPKLTGAAYGSSRYVVLEERNWIWTSDDMSSWNRHLIGFDASPTSVAFGNGAFVTVGGANGGGFILRSTNGVDWSEQSFADGSKTIFVGMTSVAFVNDQFVAVGGYVHSNGAYGVILSSPDGVTWTKQDIPSLNTLDEFGIPSVVRDFLESHLGTIRMLLLAGDEKVRRLIRCMETSSSRPIQAHGQKPTGQPQAFFGMLSLGTRRSLL